jgi:hypothetical protein
MKKRFKKCVVISLSLTLLIIFLPLNSLAETFADRSGTAVISVG